MTYQALVNQHLASARCMLVEGSRQDSANDSLQCACEHSALHLLNSAYLCQLRAIAENYHVEGIPAISDIQTLLAALVALDISAPEAAEIVVLVREGWLGGLLVALQQLCIPTVSPVPNQVIPSVSQSDITLRDDPRVESLLNIDKLQRWLLALEELVQRQVEMMVEY